ncbi:hypothetical protein [Tatumella sp. UBA2305]|uniref:hypothetical protein n=1 Tax=Tatumella sp. UBA2305 TaxID=1947647 RepID=UPI0025F50220|nr:hypothetical protein [Tatumella sp. UBA2305]
MEAKSSGDKNRIAERDFHEISIKIRINNFAGSHTINVSTAPHTEDKLQTPLSQFNELNSILAEVVGTKEKNFTSIWDKVCSEIGVNSIFDMNENQRHAAENILRKSLEKHRQKDTHKYLADLLLRTSIDNGVKNKLIKYCDITFNITKIEKLSFSQLIISLLWVEQITQDKHSKRSNKDKILQSPGIYKKVIMLIISLILCSFIIMH